jgi:hypothetical protein
VKVLLALVFLSQHVLEKIHEGSSPSRRFTSRLARENTNRIKETKQERKLKLCQEKRVLIV